MLEQSYKKIITFLNELKIDYLVIGGIAVSILGNPRETNDIDLCIFINKKRVKNFIEEAIKRNYTVEKEKMLNRAKTVGSFYIIDGDVRIDFVIASHPLEYSALKRKILVDISGVKAYFPSPEDLILLKIIPGRLQDLADIENIVKRHADKLDKKYLLDWAMRLSDEAEDSRVYNEIKKFLKFC